MAKFFYKTIEFPRDISCQLTTPLMNLLFENLDEMPLGLIVGA